jgi:hypothetical protein
MNTPRHVDCAGEKVIWVAGETQYVTLHQSGIVTVYDEDEDDESVSICFFPSEIKQINKAVKKAVRKQNNER